MKFSLILFTVVGLAFSAHAGVKSEKAKRGLIETFSKNAESVTDCGKKFKLTYDFKSLDSIAWTADKKRDDQYPYEMSSVKEIGKGINKVCADPDYKQALQAVDEIIYQPTGNDKITVSGKVTGKTLYIENFTFGSTRGASDYEKAIKTALD